MGPPQGLAYAKLSRLTRWVGRLNRPIDGKHAHYFRFCDRGHRRKATRLAGQAALTKEISLLMEATTASLPFSETTVTLHLPSTT